MTWSCRTRSPATFVLLALSLPGFAADAPRVTDAWARATPPGAKTGAAYMTLQGGTMGDRLLGATSEAAASVELHTVEESDGMARMRRLDSLEIPAGTRVELAPGGKHLMLIGLGAPLTAGDTLRLVLEFATSGNRTVEIEIRPAVAEAGHEHHGHH